MSAATPAAGAASSSETERQMANPDRLLAGCVIGTFGVQLSAQPVPFLAPRSCWTERMSHRYTPSILPLVWCLTNTLTNLRVLLAVGCVALPRVVHGHGGDRRSPLQVIAPCRQPKCPRSFITVFVRHHTSHTRLRLSYTDTRTIHAWRCRRHEPIPIHNRHTRMMVASAPMPAFVPDPGIPNRAPYWAYP